MPTATTFNPDIALAADCAREEEKCHEGVERFIRMHQAGGKFISEFLNKDLNSASSVARPYRDIRTDDCITPTIGQVAAEALDYTDGVQLNDVFNILKSVINGDKPAQQLKEEAMQLVCKIASTYAQYND